ncbi:MAG: glycosyltransferase [Pseudomonadota bacterium]
MIRMSLIISTRNRASSLRDCLEWLLDAREPCEWELVVVDNGSTDSTKSVVRRFAARTSFPVQYLYEDIPGLSRCRNKGLEAARGDIVLFIDDDCYAESGYLAAAFELLDSPGVDYFGGRVILHDPDDAPVTIKTETTSEYFAPGSFLRAGVVHGANMGFRRDVIEQIGGFNEGLGAGTPVAAGEDIEYIARASAAGFRGGYFPTPVVRHHHRRKKGQTAHLTRGYDIGRGAYYVSMILHGCNAMRYAKGWLQTVSWRTRRTYMGELRGAMQYIAAFGRARLEGKSLIPRFAGVHFDPAA